jgi:hypothetical protein
MDCISDLYAKARIVHDNKLKRRKDAQSKSLENKGIIHIDRDKMRKNQIQRCETLASQGSVSKALKSFDGLSLPPFNTIIRDKFFSKLEGKELTYEQASVSYVHDAAYNPITVDVQFVDSIINKSDASSAAGPAGITGVRGKIIWQYRNPDTEHYLCRFFSNIINHKLTEFQLKYISAVYSMAIYKKVTVSDLDAHNNLDLNKVDIRPILYGTWFCRLAQKVSYLDDSNTCGDRNSIAFFAQKKYQKGAKFGFEPNWKKTHIYTHHAQDEYKDELHNFVNHNGVNTHENNDFHLLGIAHGSSNFITADCKKKVSRFKEKVQYLKAISDIKLKIKLLKQCLKIENFDYLLRCSSIYQTTGTEWMTEVDLLIKQLVVDSLPFSLTDEIFQHLTMTSKVGGQAIRNSTPRNAISFVAAKAAINSHVKYFVSEEVMACTQVYMNTQIEVV